VNVLLTCAGRRNYLVRYFKEVLEGNGVVFAADADPTAPALQEADAAFLLPVVTASNYVDELLRVCRQRDVGMLISLNDLELPLLASERERFLKVGTLPIVSSVEVIDICFDKWKTAEFLSGLGIKTPRSYIELAGAIDDLDRGTLAYPLVVKPRWGSASIGIEYVENEEELRAGYAYAKKRVFKTMLAQVSLSDRDRPILIQEQVLGQEYGLDVLNRLDGSYMATFVKKKLSMRAGETDRAVTVASEQLEELGKAMGLALGHIGNLDCDVIEGADGPSVLELNPRFGGGYPFSHEAGANVPAALLAWAGGETPDADWFRPRANVTSSKYESLITIRS